MSEEKYSGMLVELEQKLKENSIEDFTILEFKRDQLILAGSFDFSYYHDVELKFTEVEFICCPVYFNADNFRIASSAEISSLKKTMSGFEKKGLVFYLEDTFTGNKFYIAAGGLEIKWETVYYYQRDELQPGERIADWVKP